MSMGLRLWSKLSRVSLDDLDAENVALTSDQSHMTLKFELFVNCNGEGGAWRDVFQFADRPELDVLLMLKEKAMTTFEELYNSEPTSVYMNLQIISPGERESLPTIRK